MNTADAPDRPPLALIAGPTASGKSALAVRLAEFADGVIINADASQVYKDLRVLSARPSETDVAAVPHRLFGHIDGSEACSVARWAAEARLAIADAHAAGRSPILVGGTGLYLRILIDGLAPIPPIDPAVRAVVRALPVADAYAALAREDARAAARLHASDTTRVARALEVVMSSGRPLAEWQRARVGGIGHRVRLVPLILLPPRDWLYARCDARFAGMLDRGAVAEVETLLARGLDPALPVMRAIGVREIAAWLAGEIDRAEMIDAAVRATRRYAKRQYTWFAHQPPAEWTRYLSQLENDSMEELVIKLRNKALTR